MRFIIIASLLFLMSCSEYSETEQDIQDLNEMEAYSLYLSNDVEVRIIGKNVPQFYLDQLAVKLEARIIQSVNRNSISKLRQGKSGWEDGDFLPIPGMQGSYQWSNVDLRWITEQRYKIISGPYGEDFQWWIIDEMIILLGKNRILVDFIRSDYNFKESNLCSVTASLYGKLSDFSAEEGVLQSETRYFRKGDRCLTPYVYGK